MSLIMTILTCINLQLKDRRIEELQAEVRAKNELIVVRDSQMDVKDDLITRKDIEITAKLEQIQVFVSCREILCLNSTYVTTKQNPSKHFNIFGRNEG